MPYTLRRGQQEYGPYTLADLRRFAVSGHVGPQDELRQDGDAVWHPARLVLGNAAWPAFQAPPLAASPAPNSQGGAAPHVPPGAYLPAYQVPAMANGAPLPADLHWALLLLLTFFTCGLAAYVWLLVQAWWVRKIDPRSNALWMLIAYIAVGYATMIPNVAMSVVDQEELGLTAIALLGLIILLSISSFVLYLIGVFSMRRSMNQYFQHVENIGLQLGPIMTFFFAVYYFQYHLSRIARWKKTGVLA